MKHLGRKKIAILLVLIMLCSMLQVQVFAEDADKAEPKAAAVEASESEDKDAGEEKDAATLEETGESDEEDEADEKEEASEETGKKDADKKEGTSKEGDKKDASEEKESDKKEDDKKADSKSDEKKPESKEITGSGNGIAVKIKGSKEDLPDNTSLSIKEAPANTSELILKKVNASVEEGKPAKKIGSMVAAQISLTANGSTVKPKSSLQFSLQTSAITKMSNPKVFRIYDGEVSQVDAEFNKEAGRAEFQTSTLATYVIADIIEEAAQVASDKSEAEEKEEEKKPEAEEKTEEKAEDKEEKPAAEEKEEETPEAEEKEEEKPVIKAEKPSVSYRVSLPSVTVTAEAEGGAFDEEVELIVLPLSPEGNAYHEAEKVLAKEGQKYDGMLAFDIFFRNKETKKEVEPDGAVSISMTLNQKSLAKVEAKNIDADTVAVTHITDDNEADLVADAANKTDGSVEVTKDKEEVTAISADFTVDSFSTYTITWENAAGEKESATVHWGTYEDGEFTELQSTTTLDTTASSVDVAVNIDGYYYVNTSYKENETDEETTDLGQETVLKKADNGWTIGDTTVANGSHIYVNYAPMGSGGYTPPSPPPEDVLPPDTEKTVTYNGDGTYTIQLDVEGKQAEEVTKVGANVIVIVDRTQSMSNSMSGGGNRMDAAKSALNTLIDTLNPGPGNDQNLINFAAVEFANSRDYMEGLDWTQSRDDMESYANGLSYYSGNIGLGTCWQAGLQGGIDYANEAATDADLKNNATYVLFVTDGNPNGWVNGQGNYQQQGSGQFVEAAYIAAVPNANTLAGISNLYGIFCGSQSDYENLERLINNAGGVDVIYGSSASDMEDAFRQIAQTIVDNLGSSEVSVDDGVPDLSSISANVSAGEAGGFEYYITPKGESQQEWEDAPGAAYDKTNGVTWDLGEAGTLQDGWIYTLKFTVWPSQDAYDLIADLNNGIKDYDDLTDAQKDAIEGSKETGYTLKTNTHLYTTFTDTKGNTYREENDARSKAMDLPTKTISVLKIWNNDLDGRNPDDYPDGIDLELQKDGDDYLDVHVGPDNNWKKDEIYISMGQIKGDEILEPGHDYEVVEPESFSYHWHLTSDIYHPMVIDGEPVMLIRDDNASDGYKLTGSDGAEHNYVEAEDSGTNVLKATNDRRSWLQLEKTITPDSAPKDTLFEYTITLTEEESGEDIWFSAYDGSSIVKDLETDATAEEGNTGYYYVASGTTFSVKIKAGWTLRFTNLPVGTEYSFTEIQADGFKLTEAKGDVKVNTSAVQEDPEAAEVDGLTVTGHVNVPNCEFYVYYTNEYAETEITVTKKWEDDSDRDGIRPSAEEFAEYLSLLQNGEATTDYDDNLTITDNEDDTFTIKYEKLPKYIDNEEAEYKIEESEIEDYTTEGSPAEDGGTITNTHEIERTEISVSKVWDDHDDEDGIRPESVSVQLLANGDAEGDPVTLDDSNEWKYTWEKLPKNDGGEAIEYTVEEVKDDVITGEDTSTTYAYKVEEGDEEGTFIVTNTHTPRTELEVEKKWVNADGSDTWPEGKEVELQLMADGEAVDGKTATLTADQTSYKFTELPKYSDDDAEIEYDVEEIEVPGYTSEKEGPEEGKVTFTNTEETTEVEVEKKWSNIDGSDTWPDGKEVKIQLTADGEAVDGKTATLTADQTSCKFESLPKYQSDGTTEIEYSVDEVEVDGYETAVGAISDGKITITNTEKEAPPEPVEITVTKEWKNLDGSTTWPKDMEVTVNLLADGGKVKSAKLTSSQKSYTFENLDKYQADGETEIKYTVEEEEVTGYTGKVGEIKDGKVTVTNTENQASGQIQLSAHKTLSGRALKANEFSFELRDASGNLIETKKNDASGNVTFSAISVDKSVFTNGAKTVVKKFNVKEVVPANKDAAMTYDTRVYTAEVTLTDAGNGKINASVAWKVGAASANRAEFVNTYKAKVTPTPTKSPTKAAKTGDTSPIMLLVILMLIALLGIGVIGRRALRRH